MNSKKIIVLAATSAVLVSQASAATLFGVISGPTVSESSAVGVDPNILVTTAASSVYQRGSGVTAGAGSVFNTVGWDPLTTQAAAIAGGNFISWSFTSSLGMNLSKAKISYSRSSVSSFDDMVIQIDTGSGFVDVFSDNDISTTTATGEVNTIDLSAFDNVTSATFRLVGWNATSTSAAFRFNNNAGVGTIGASNVSFLLEGEPVPEPATMAILAAAGLVAARRRKAR